ncbi:hypothetical protein OAJ89_02390 [Alphaproteobacteria bacterium]|nr:hypothetical protein [Alphaproteobacteria bacterium]
MHLLSTSEELVNKSASMTLQGLMTILIYLNLIGRCCSGVGCSLAKVEVEGSNPFARSKPQPYLQISNSICNIVAI